MKVRYLVLAPLLVVPYWLGSSDKPTPPNVVVGGSLHRDPRLVSDAKKLGIDSTPLNLKLVSHIKRADEKVDGTIIGVFYRPNSIQIRKGLSRTAELNILAYEYMHYVWQNLPASQKKVLTMGLKDYRKMNPNFNRDVSRYHGPSKIINDEMDSTACTRVAPYLLSRGFNSYCDHYIKHRAILF